MAKIRNIARTVRDIALELPEFVSKLRRSARPSYGLKDASKYALRRGKIDPIIRSLTDRVEHASLTQRMGGDNAIYRAIRGATLLPRTKRVSNVASWHATDVLERAKVLPKRQATRIKNTIARVNQDDVDTARWLSIHGDTPIGYRASPKERIALASLEPRTLPHIQMKTENRMRDTLDADYRRKRGLALLGLGAGTTAGIISASRGKKVEKRYPPFRPTVGTLPNTRHAVGRSGKYFAKNAIDAIKQGHASSSRPSAQMESMLGLRSSSSSRRPSAGMMQQFPWLRMRGKSIVPDAMKPYLSNRGQGSTFRTTSDIMRRINGGKI